MVSRLHARLSYANVTATFALFIALGGVSYAAVNLPKNSVDAKAIEKNAVKAPEIAKNAVKAPEIATNAVGSGEVTDGSLLCADFAPGQPACQQAVAPGGGGDGVGFTNTSVRSTTGSIPFTCVACTGSCLEPFTCTSPATTIKAPCAPGERATGGGHGGVDGGTPNELEDRPDPVTGTPDGWAVKVGGAGGGSSTSSRPPRQVTVYAVCAA